MMRYVLFLIAFVIGSSALAQNTKIKKLEAQRKIALQEIANTNLLLLDTKKSASTIMNRIGLISSQISSRQKLLDVITEEIDGFTTSQKTIEKDITILGAELKEQRESYAKAVNVMIINRQSQNTILFVLSGKSLSESYRRFHYLKEYSEWRSKQADEIKVKQNELREKEEQLAKMKAERQILLKQREHEQANLKSEQNNFQKEMNEAKTKQKELQKVLAQKQKQAKALDREISKLIAEEVAKQEREAKRTASKNNKTNNKTSNKTSSSSNAGKTNSQTVSPRMNKQDIVLANDFSANRGKLPFPITGNYTIVGRFGIHKHEKWNVSTSSGGLDIQSQAGASAKAVFDGEVSRIIPFPGYNNCIIIRHGNYYTFYGNIQSVSVRTGDKVKTGQTLGQVYTDPDTNASVIHFQLWKGTNKLNPQPWLR